MGAGPLRSHALRAHLSRRVPFLVAIAIAAVAVTFATAYARPGAPEYRATVHLLVRPAGSVTAHDVPDTLRVLDANTALMTSVVGLLDSESFLQSAAAQADV